ncbi:unnamed protein product, partial [Prorocentrum cordatum]
EKGGGVADAKHSAECGTQVEYIELEPSVADGKLEHKSFWQEVLGEKMLEMEAAEVEYTQSVEANSVEFWMPRGLKDEELQAVAEELKLAHNDSKNRVEEVETETRDLANRIDEQRRQIAELEMALNKQYGIASLAGVPAFLVLAFGLGVSLQDHEIVDGGCRPCNVKQQQRYESQGRKLIAADAEVGNRGSQRSSADLDTLGGLGNHHRIAENQRSSQHAYATGESNGDVLTDVQDQGTRVVPDAYYHDGFVCFVCLSELICGDSDSVLGQSAQDEGYPFDDCQVGADAVRLLQCAEEGAQRWSVDVDMCLGTTTQFPCYREPWPSNSKPWQGEPLAL